MFLSIFRLERGSKHVWKGVVVPGSYWHPIPLLIVSQTPGLAYGVEWLSSGPGQERDIGWRTRDSGEVEFALFQKLTSSLSVFKCWHSS